MPVAGAQQASLTVRNTTAQPVDIVWLDDSGAEEAIGAVEAGQTVTLDAAVGWTFRAAQGGARIAEHTVAGTAGESWDVAASRSDPITAATAPPAMSQVDTSNPGYFPLQLIQIEPDGREVDLGRLEPGTMNALRTPVGTALAYKRDGEIVATYITTGVPGEQFPPPAPPAAPAPGAQTTFAASNPTAAPAELFWLRDDGVEVAMGVLAPRSGTVLQTAVGHRFVYRRGGELVASHAATGAVNDRFEVPAPPPPPPGQPTTLIVANPTVDTVELFWLRDDGVEVPMGVLAPRAELPFRTAVGHRFVFRRAGGVVAQHTATGLDDDRFAAPGAPAPPAGAPTALSAANPTAGPVELFWIRADGTETRMRQLQPGEEVKDLATKVSNRFVFRRDGQQIAEHTASGLAGDRFVAPFVLALANYTDRPVELAQLGADGREISRGVIAPGLRTATTVTQGDILVFKDDGQEIDRYVAADRPGNREFSVGQRPEAAPQFSLTSTRTSGVLVPAPDSLLQDDKKQAFQTYFTRSANVALEQQLTDGQMAVLRVRTDAVTWLSDGGRRLNVRLATIDGSGVTMMQNGRPAMPSAGSAGKWFVGKVTLYARPTNFGAFADTVWPRAENDYTSVSITDTTSWNASLSANANAGASPGVGGGPSFGIGGSSSKSVGGQRQGLPAGWGGRAGPSQGHLHLDRVRHLGQAEDDR